MVAVQTLTDYRKWILFNNSLSDYKELYDLYRAIHDIKESGQSRCMAVQENGLLKYVVESKSMAEKLEVNEEGRRELIAYLVQHYFHTDNVEAWFKEKQGNHDRSVNHSHVTNHSEYGSDGKMLSVKPHRKERRYFNVMLAFSVIVYAVLGLALIMVFIENVVQGLIYLAGIVLIVGCVFLLQWVVKGFLVGLIKGNAVRITEKQYPQVFEIVREQARHLGLKDMPDIYVGDGAFNAFVMRFVGAKVLMLYSPVLETALHGDDSILRFVIGHELGHIKRKHLTTGKWLILARIIPFLSNAYSRGCEYTCDRVGFHFSRKGAIEGILILSTGKEIYSKINVDQFVDDSVNNGSFWMWFSEKFLTHPHVSKRLNEIRKYAERF